MSAFDKTRESDEKIDATPDKIVNFVNDVYALGVKTLEQHPQEAARDAVEIAGAVGVAAAVTYLARGNSVRVLKSAESMFSGKLAISIGLEPVGNFFGKVSRLARGANTLTFAERSGFYRAKAAPGEAFNFGTISSLDGLDRNSSKFQELIGGKFNLDLQKLESGKMAILHPRFKYPEKQLFGKVDERRDLSLWGDKAQGVGVVEYADLNHQSGYLASARSVVRITARTDEAQAENFAHRGASGVFIGRPEQGLILTNEHVVKDGRLLKIETSSGTQFSAKVVHADSKLDLAVIQVTNAPAAMNFPVVTLSERAFVASGEKVGAVGHHGALKGIIASPGHYQTYDGDIQLDVLSLDSATKGSSGGPIFDKAGQLVSLTAKSLRVAEKVERSLVGGVNIRHIRAFIDQVDAILADTKPVLGKNVSEFDRF
jgi:S1-C subfamily serine protease